MTVQDHIREELVVLALIAAGGFTGSALHFWILGFLPALEATLVVNTLGSFLLGVFMYETLVTGRFGSRARILIGAGFLGAFTSFSALALIVVQQSPVIAAGYMVVTLLLGLSAVGAGRTLVYFVHGGVC